MGNYSRRFVQLQWGGTLHSPQEIWSCSLKCAVPTGADAAGSSNVDALDVGALLNAPAGLAQAVINYHTNPALVLSSAAKLTFVKANKIDVDGRYIEDQTYEHPVSNLGGASVIDPRFPTQISLCVSLTTGFSRGTAHRGRFYLPMPNEALASDGRYTAAYPLAVANRSMIFVNDINTVFSTAGSPVRVCVMSKKDGASGQRAVSGIEVGRVLDTQRRRRNAMNEQYVANA